MKIFTYTEDIPGYSDPALLEMSRHSFAEQELRFEVLGREDAQPYPAYRIIMDYPALYQKGHKSIYSQICHTGLNKSRCDKTSR